MFLNRFYDWVYGDNGGALIPLVFLGLIASIIGCIFLVILNGYEKYFLYLIPFIIIFSEWAYIDYIKNQKCMNDIFDIVFIKIGYMVGTLPFVLCLLTGWLFRKNIIEFLFDTNFLKVLLVIVCTGVVVFLVIGYVWINILIAKRYKKYRK